MHHLRWQERAEALARNLVVDRPRRSLAFEALAFGFLAAIAIRSLL